MGSDDLFKKRREARTQRKHEYKPPKANSYLIVTEGERTEPLYFKGMQKLIQEKVGGVVDIIEQPLIDVHGEGCSTTRLVEVADQIIKDAKSSIKMYGLCLIRMILMTLTKQYKKL